jgi:hypothetical protein
MGCWETRERKTMVAGKGRREFKRGRSFQNYTIGFTLKVKLFP